MNQKEFLTIVVISLIVAVISSALTTSITGNVVRSVTSTNRYYPEMYTKTEVDGKFASLRAASCDVDSICEVQGKISSKNPITLSSESGAAKIEGDLSLTKIGATGAVIIKSNDVGSLTITPQSGSAKLEGDLTLTSVDSTGGVVLKTVLDQLVVSASLSRFQGTIASNNLVGNGTSYVCVNDKGILIRSNTACR
ncbi:MAG: hypothetical protein WC867_01745 [Candidatus Pacearchaeota archaeon]|jgi:cytoskeletal protein CcmA (bactofilin family)